MAGFITVRIDGLSALASQLQRMGANAPSVLGKALYQEAETIMTRSKAEFVPVDTGALRSTGHVEQPVVSGSGVSVTMGYGGPAAPYAIYVHERLDVHHPVGQAKYLEQPTMEALNGMTGRIAATIKGDLGL